MATITKLRPTVTPISRPRLVELVAAKVGKETERFAYDPEDPNNCVLADRWRKSLQSQGYWVK